MPADWNDHAGWEAWYRHWKSGDPLGIRRQFYPFRVGSVTVDSLSGFVWRWQTAGWSEVWAPGCGMDPLGRLLAYFGMKVVATDVSPTAVEFQNSDLGRIDAYVEQYDLGPEVPGGSFRAELHDFRTPFADSAFDLIQNLNALQAFPLADLTRIAGVHARALKPGGVAAFDGIEQGERQEAVERALEEAGFILPMLRYNRRIRAALLAEGIPYTYMRIGYQALNYTLTVAPVGEFADEQRREFALKRLGEIVRELEAVRQAQAAEEEAAMTGEMRFAEVLPC
jgi:SAM-dependent methyltransferase